MDVLKYIRNNQFSGQSVELHELDALLIVIQDMAHLFLEGIGIMWVCDQSTTCFVWYQAWQDDSNHYELNSNSMGAFWVLALIKFDKT